MSPHQKVELNGCLSHMLNITHGGFSGQYIRSHLELIIPRVIREKMATNNNRFSQKNEAIIAIIIILRYTK
jgi:hypothetical protein